MGRPQSSKSLPFEADTHTFKGAREEFMRRIRFLDEKGIRSFMFSFGPNSAG
jgi:hypothetical protein